MRVIAAAALVVALVACGGDDADEARPTTTTTTTASTTTTSLAATCSASSLSPTVEDEPGLPDAVAAMRRDLVRAASTCDYDALAALVDRDGNAVRYTFGEGNDPIGSWRAQEEAAVQEPLPLRSIRVLLELPYVRTGDPDHVTFAWPRAFAEEHPTDEQLQEIADAGLYTLDQLREMASSGVGYLGYRILITEAGDWTAFVAGD